jgi:hypothetical protein
MKPVFLAEAPTSRTHWTHFLGPTDPLAMLPPPLSHQKRNVLLIVGISRSHNTRSVTHSGQCLNVFKHIETYLNKPRYEIDLLCVNRTRQLNEPWTVLKQSWTNWLFIWCRLETYRCDWIFGHLQNVHCRNIWWKRWREQVNNGSELLGNVLDYLLKALFDYFGILWIMIVGSKNLDNRCSFHHQLIQYEPLANRLQNTAWYLCQNLQIIILRSNSARSIRYIMIFKGWLTICQIFCEFWYFHYHQKFHRT